MDKSQTQDDRVTAIPRNIKGEGKVEIDVISYAGYIDDVDPPANKNHLYYWFFESETTTNENRSELPLVIWLSGGPGASSLAGLFLENGPYRMSDDGTVEKNDSGWNKQFHLLYWDQPVGTGFSITDDGSYCTSEDELAEQLYNALQGFLRRHKEYRDCPLYVSGESYAGKYVPFFARKITEKNQNLQSEASHRRRHREHRDQINLVGLSIGDGWMNPLPQTRKQLDYGYAMGLIDTRQKQTLTALCDDLRAAIKTQDMKSANELGGDVSNILLACGGNPDIYDVRRGSSLTWDVLEKYFALDAVKDAIHVPRDRKWEMADEKGPVTEALVDDLYADMTEILPKLIAEYRVLMYTGDFDMSCGFMGTEEILLQVARADWKEVPRKVWTDPRSKQVCGFVKQLAAANVHDLTQIALPGAGHLVPHDKPVVSLAMIGRWISGQVFPGTYPATARADTAWQDTGIDVRSGQGVEIDYATGTWLASPTTGFCSAGGKQGTLAKDGYTLPGAPEGALCGRIGDSGKVFLVGDHAMAPAETSGRLFFCINDDLDGRYGEGLRDNYGAVTANVSVDEK